MSQSRQHHRQKSVNGPSPQLKIASLEKALRAERQRVKNLEHDVAQLRTSLARSVRDAEIVSRLRELVRDVQYEAQVLDAPGAVATVPVALLTELMKNRARS